MLPRCQAVYFDCRRFLTPALAHSELSRALAFPEWYGGNLDALFDCLSELPPTALLFCGSELLEAQLGDYAEALLSVLWAAVRANPGLLIGFPASAPDELLGDE